MTIVGLAIASLPINTLCSMNIVRLLPEHYPEFCIFKRIVLILRVIGFLDSTKAITRSDWGFQGPARGYL